MTNKQLYESIMKNVSELVKKALNEDTQYNFERPLDIKNYDPVQDEKTVQTCYKMAQKSSHKIDGYLYQRCIDFFNEFGTLGLIDALIKYGCNDFYNLSMAIKGALVNPTADINEEEYAFAIGLMMCGNDPVLFSKKMKLILREANGDTTCVVANVSYIDEKKARRIMKKNLVCSDFFFWDFENWKPLPSKESLELF